MTENDSTTIPVRCCTKCGIEKPATLEFFYFRKTGKYNLRSECKICEKEQATAYVKAHPEQNRAHVRRWRKANPDKHRAQGRKGYYARKDHIAKYAKTRRRNNPTIAVVAAQKRNTRKRELPNSFTVKDWSIALEYFNGQCAYCGNPPGLFREMRFHQDHFIPLSDKSPDNPGYVPTNVLPACGSCNDSKHNFNAKEWLDRKFGKRKANQILKKIDAYFEWLREMNS